MLGLISSLALDESLGVGAGLLGIGYSSKVSFVVISDKCIRLKI